MRAPLLMKVLIPLLVISVGALLLSGVENARAEAFQFPFGLGPAEMAGPQLLTLRFDPMRNMAWEVGAEPGTYQKV